MRIAVCLVARSAAGAGVNSGFVVCPPNRPIQFGFSSGECIPHYFHRHCSANSRYLSPDSSGLSKVSVVWWVLDLCDPNSTILQAILSDV
jgi:hypothetical protein